jgi:hypothetical protein
LFSRYPLFLNNAKFFKAVQSVGKSLYSIT